MKEEHLEKALKDVSIIIKGCSDLAEGSDCDVAHKYAMELYEEVLAEKVGRGEISVERGAGIINVLFDLKDTVLNKEPLNSLLVEDPLVNELYNKLNEIYNMHGINQIYVHGATVDWLAATLTYNLGVREILEASKNATKDRDHVYHGSTLDFRKQNPRWERSGISTS